MITRTTAYQANRCKPPCNGAALSSVFALLVYCTPLSQHDAAASDHDQHTRGAPANVTFVRIDRTAYADRLRGFWLGANIANWTGLPTENVKAEPPFFTDDDWGRAVGRNGETIDFVLNSDPWGADDDTDIEYVYQAAMTRLNTHVLSAEQIADAWQRHIDLPLLWVSNLAALGQMQHGRLPPATSLPENNPMWEMIDAQLTTEIFGALAPGRPDVALEMAGLPIRTTAYLHSAWAAEFYVIMHALAATADADLPRHEQLRFMADQARKRIPDWSYVADMYDFVKADFDRNPDKTDWESTRDKLYRRYQLDGTAGYTYRYPWDAGINFGASIVSLFYGQGDYRKTVRIGTLAGWDSDNPTATWGGLLGLMMGHRALTEYFGQRSFSDHYQISRTRVGFAREPDTFTHMATRGLAVIDRMVVGAGGRIDANQWHIPTMPREIVAEPSVPVTVPWVTIEDSDPRWQYTGFKTHERLWNASGATLTKGNAGCEARITLGASAIQLYAYRSDTSGSIEVSINDGPATRVSLQTNASPNGQYYAKVYARDDLDPGRHTLHIRCADDDASKNIDMLSIIPATE